MRSWYYLLLLCLMLGCRPIRAETIVIGAEDDWIPYSKSDGTGMANDIVRAAFASVGIQVKFKVQPYNRLLKLVEIGELLGVFNVPKDNNAEHLFYLGKEPLYYAHSAYFENTQHPLAAKNRDELHRVKVAVVVGYGYGDHYLQSVAEKQILPVVTHSETLGLKMLAAGRVDSTILFDKTARELIKKLHLSGKIEQAFSNENVPIYLAFSRQRLSESQHYANKLDQGLATIKANGTYHKILENY